MQGLYVVTTPVKTGSDDVEYQLAVNDLAVVFSVTRVSDGHLGDIFGSTSQRKLVATGTVRFKGLW